MPHPDRIFHYTTVESLALILKSRKLRFSRADRVDDATEAPSVQNIEFSKYLFISCWTGEGVESIPQWQLYTPNMAGVRIELPAYPFIQKRFVPPAAWRNITLTGPILGPLSCEEMWGNSYTVMWMVINRDSFAGFVNYVDDVRPIFEKAVSITRSSDGTGSISIDGLVDLARTKNSNWKFQSEYRFSLVVFPSLPLPPEGPGQSDFLTLGPQHVLTSLLTGVDPDVKYIDVDIRSSALSELVVTTGPLCSAGTKVCVESLVRQYAPHGRVRNSELEGRVRAKSAA